MASRLGPRLARAVAGARTVVAGCQGAWLLQPFTSAGGHDPESNVEVRPPAEVAVALVPRAGREIVRETFERTVDRVGWKPVPRRCGRADGGVQVGLRSTPEGGHESVGAVPR